MTFTKEQKTHQLKIYPEHFSAVLTGVKRAELRKNDRDFKAGDTLHLMETPKGSCSPTGEFVNAVVTHIADISDWLPGYVLLSIEREPAYTAPPAQVSAPDFKKLALELVENLVDCNGADDSAVKQYLKWTEKTCRAAMLQGAEQQNRQQNIPENIPVTQFKPVADLYGLTSSNGGETSFTFDAVEARDFIDGGWLCQEYVTLERYQEAMLQGVAGNSPAIPDGWVMVPADPTAEMLQSGISAHYERSQIQIHDRPAPGPMTCAYVAMLAAAPQQEVKS